MSDERCDCCDLPAYSCGRALEQRARQQDAAQREILRRTGWFPARFPGKCEQCGEWFEAGSLIKMDMQALGWRAECCT